MVEQIQKHIEHSRDESQASLNIICNSMSNAFQVTNQSHHRKDGFNAHSLVPGALLAKLEIFRDAIFVSKTEIGENDGLPNKWFDNGMKMLVIHIHRGPTPGDYSTGFVEQPAELDPDTPATFVTPFLTNLSSTAPFPNGKEQFDGIRVDDSEETGFSHEQVTPDLMRFEQPLQTSTLW